MSTHRVRRATVVGAVVGSTVMSGCFTTSADFREKAETFIVDDEGLAATIGVALTSATCEEPSNQDVGTVFTCTATDANGEERRFDVVIAESDSIVVTEADLP